MIHRSPEIPFLGFLPRRPAPQGEPVWFAYGRSALKEGLRRSGLAPGDAVLVPAYICHSLLDPLRALGLEVRLHRVREEAWAPDWADLERLAPGARAVVMVHYFGIPQDLAAYRGFCDRNGLLLVEDNAHGHGGEVDGRPLGSFGDIGFSSPRKSFPILSGGCLLRAPAGTAGRGPDGGLEPRSLAWRQARAWVRHAIEACDPLRRLAIAPEDYASQEIHRDESIRDWAMDAGSLELLRGQEIGRCRARRQACWRVWDGWIRRQGLRPVHPSLPPGCLPLAYAALCGDAARSRAWFAWGHARGFDVFSWPTLPREVVCEGDPTLDLWRRCVCFPVHQDLDPEALGRRIARLEGP